MSIHEGVISTQKQAGELFDYLLSGVRNGEEYRIKVSKGGRTHAQNKKSWVVYRDIAEQMPWQGRMLNRSEWKDLLTVNFYRELMTEQEFKGSFLHGIGSGYAVFTGKKTSEFTKIEFTNYLHSVHAFCAESGVRFSADSEQIFEYYGVVL